MIEVSRDETERILLNQLNDKNELKPTLWKLAQFYKLTEQPGKALMRLMELMVLLSEPVSKPYRSTTRGRRVPG